MTYHDVEKNHGVKHICDIPDFKPKKPYIHVSIIEDFKGNFRTDWDVQSCSSFLEEVGKCSKSMPSLELPT
tara:strand:+ start:134 stop:346 length:213 start_codon:yes stop_codon:yes gene_type:complete